MAIIDALTEQRSPTPSLSLVPCNLYSSAALAELYNRTRIDYIVPMPMNARKMDEYVRDYDVDLGASVVVEDSNNGSIGIGMLGLREDRAWITRLGVAPEQRGRKIGLLIMQELLAQAQVRGAAQVQLEVIRGNKPPYELFRKVGFRERRELLVLNRPPRQHDTSSQSGVETHKLDADEIATCLRSRSHSLPSWLDEAPSLLNSTDIIGFRATHENGACGWIVCKQTRLQLSHFVLDVKPQCPADVTLALLDALHRSHPAQDAKYENLPADSPYLPALQSFGYIEVFRRIEMFRPLP